MCIGKQTQTVPILKNAKSFRSHSQEPVIFPDALTLLIQRCLSYRNKSTDLQSKSLDWFLYDRYLRHETSVKLQVHDDCYQLSKRYLRTALNSL